MAKTKKKKRGLAQRLMDLEEQALTLHDSTTNPAERRELLELAGQLSAEASRLIDLKLSSSTRKYAAATRGLDAACEATQEEIEKVDNVRGAIAKISAALELVCKIAA